MLFASHMLVGAAAGEMVENPFLAFLLGFFLHFVLDAIPHFDTVGKNILNWRQLLIIAVDGVAGLFILYLLFTKYSEFHWSFVFGALGSITPDLLDNVPFWQKKFQSNFLGKAFHNFHTKVQPNPPGVFVGVLTQIIVISIVISVFLFLM